MKQVLFIFLAMLLGIIFYQTYHLTFLIRYSVMLMLFIAFLQIDFNLRVMHRNHLWVALANILIPILVYFSFIRFGSNLALAAFTIAIAPTAAGAPVMAAFLKTRIEFVTASVIFTTPIIAIILPILLPYLIPVEKEINTLEVLLPTTTLVFLPLISSQLIRRHASHWIIHLRKYYGLAFYLFIFNLLIASGKASHFVRFESNAHWSQLLLIALAIGLVCLFCFKIGEWIIGSKGYTLESGLALGRKNTMFSLWVALTFINPMVALGPIFYILAQNTYNSWQLYRLNKKEKS